MTYSLYLDDIRNPIKPNDWVVVRSSADAIDLVVREGMPSYMSLDHDLGGEDTTMVFLKAMYALYPDGPVPLYNVHSSNPVGRLNIVAYLDSWARSLKL